MTQEPDIHLLRPENQLEFDLLQTPEFREGMQWGKPRPGHPEGRVLLHVREVLDNIESLPLADADRVDLRLVAFAHDTFKYREDQLSHQGNPVHHGHLAARYLKQWNVPKRVQELVHWHDEAYYSWRMYQLGMEEDSLTRLSHLIQQLSPWWSLFEAFFRADTLTGDKDPAPLTWLKKWQPKVQMYHRLNSPQGTASRL